jgi:hypothetical protein
MDLRSFLTGLIAWGLYPAWLAAGGLDYLCHRRTDIDHTSGVTESWLHVAQLACMALIVALGVLAHITLAVFIVLALAALAHSALAFIDVSYTQSRRAITPLEQLAHNYLEVLPLVVVALLAVIHWPLEKDVWFAARPGIGWGHALLLGSFAVLAGVPVFEELLRTLRTRAMSLAAIEDSALRLRHDGGRAL